MVFEGEEVELDEVELEEVEVVEEEDSGMFSVSIYLITIFYLLLN